MSCVKILPSDFTKNDKIELCLLSKVRPSVYILCNLCTYVQYFMYILAYACLADGTDCIIIHHLCNILCTVFDLKLYDCMNRNSIILQVYPFPYKINDYDMNKFVWPWRKGQTMADGLHGVCET